MSRLYIRRSPADEWHEAVLDDKEDVRFTFTFDNLENPTNYVSERSMSVKLPRCEENNKLFGHFGRPDSMIIAGGYDASIKMQYMAMATGMVISEGDCVVDKIDREAYHLSLTGTQSAIFSRLLNAGYSREKAQEDPKYWLFTDWIKDNARMDAMMVYASWKVAAPVFSFSEAQRFKDTLYLRYGLAAMYKEQAFVATLIGFAPTLQGKYPDFENDKWLNRTIIDGSRAIKADIVTVLSERTWLGGTPADSYSAKGAIYEQQLNEYRSYYQQPYIYVSMLWQLIAKECRGITGYNMVLDNRWFSPNNDELNGLVYMLPQPKIDESRTMTNTLADCQDMAALPVYTMKIDQIDVPGMSTVTLSATSDTVLAHTGEKITFEYTLRALLDILPRETLFISHKIMFGNTKPLHIRVKVAGADADAYKDYLILNVTEGCGRDYFTDKSIINGIPAGVLADSMRRAYIVTTSDYSPLEIDQQTTMDVCNFRDELTVLAESDGYLSLEVTAEFYGSNNYTPFALSSAEAPYQAFFPWYNVDKAPSLTLRLANITVSRSINMRSGRPLSLASVFGDISPFSVLLQYAKAHHLIWEINERERTLTVKRSQDAFADYMAAMPLDITENVSADITVKPLSWDTRSVLFNMGDMGTSYTEDYQKRQGIPYGSKRVVTQNTVNDGEKSLFTDGNVIKASAMASLTAVPVANIMNADTTTMVEGDAEIINVKDDEAQNVGSNFYYRRNFNRTAGNALTAGWRDWALITDDNLWEVMFNTFCWHGVVGSADIASFSMPVFSTMSPGGLSVLFAPVREVYTSASEMATEYLYERAWQHYIGEVYNVQNKTLEVAIHLPRSIFNRVRRNPLVIIDHMLYILLEVRSWGEHNTTCRCKLRQISNINNLIS